MTHYLLKLFVDTDDITLMNLYKQATQNHNSKIEAYWQEAGSFDAGFDLFCPETQLIPGRETHKVNHEIKTAMEFVEVEGLGRGNKPVGYYLYPRSSTGTKTPLRLANSVGIIDASYRGHIIAVFDNWQERPFTIDAYQRMAQLCPPNLTYPIYVELVKTAAELGQTSRGNNGFGSTGK